MGACLISLDYFKAYDRVLVSFLLLVMNKMGFGPKFCNWIKMLHDDAKTKFILSGLTTAIDICFSIRQGDPLSMILYIIHIEPLLTHIEKRIEGLKLPCTLAGQLNFQQEVEAYCDDLNILTENDRDFTILDDSVTKFEKVSGAILSRNSKCKVIGFGKWKDRAVWPLPYLDSVTELKVFGIIVMNNVRSLITKNWENRFLKFQQCIISWSSRVLDTLSQRIQVIKTFGLSRIYYVASILPLPKNYVNKIEQVIGKFLWSFSGRLIRVSITDLKLSPERGGLGLVCIDSMAKSLLLTQLLRLLKSEDSHSVAHIGYWIGEVLEDLMPDLFIGIHAAIVPPYFQKLAELVADSKMNDLVSPATWNTITNKNAYMTHARNFPPTKLESDLGVDMTHIWKKLCSPSLTCWTRETLFLLLHNKLPNKERLFRVGVNPDPYCVFCINSVGTFICDREHVFCTCSSISALWHIIRELVDPLLKMNISDIDLLTLNFDGGSYCTEVTWLIASYVHEVWTKICADGGNISQEELFGFLRFKFKNDQIGSRMKMKIIPNFL